jgi:hypothetical protein
MQSFFRFLSAANASADEHPTCPARAMPHEKDYLFAVMTL